jgi:bifunctional non-homologous end joining protein LigD
MQAIEIWWLLARVRLASPCILRKSPCISQICKGEDRFAEDCILSHAVVSSEPLPSAGLWLHEIKHDGFRIIARKDGERVMLYSRPGNDFTRRFPLIVEALVRLRSRSCIIDGEAVACDDNGVASFDRIRHHRHNDRVFL